ncbi:hypothetical protein EBB07_19090 [Paenibacillaceae bacterium]|nr:hypothetical protein EBB07_19090 [Paenibacillaceae bacterium]
MFEGSVERVDAFLQQHASQFQKSDLSEFSRAAREESLSDTRINVFSWVYSVHVDWREEDEEIVRLFGERLPEVLKAVCTDEGLLVNYAGVSYPIPLSFSHKDRYITIRGLADIIKEGYEIRLFRSSYYSDTHAFLLLPRSQWHSLTHRYDALVEEVFQTVSETLDFP